MEVVYNPKSKTLINTTTGNDTDTELLVQGARLGINVNNGSTYFGTDALINDVSTKPNIAIGTEALLSNTTGKYNIGIGNFTDSNNFNECLILGSGAIATDNNQLVLANVNQNLCNPQVQTIVCTHTMEINLNGVIIEIPFRIKP